MNVYVLNGLHGADVKFQDMAQKLIKALNKKAVVKVTNLKESNIAFCKGCFGCWIKSPGICVIDDDGREIARDAINSDIVVYLSPVTFGGFSSVMKKAVDRLIPNILPFFKKINREIHHKQRYARRPEIIAVGLLETVNSEEEEIFAEMIGRIALNQDTSYSSFFLHNSESEEIMDKTIQEICMEVKVDD